MDTKDSSCPICLHDSVRLLRGPCQHEYCRDCIERHLLSPTVTQPHERQRSESSVVTPTLGLCPLCREELYLFDLTDPADGTLVYQKNFNILQSPLAGAVYAEAGKGIGWGSFHFPPHSNNNNNNNNINTVASHHDDCTALPDNVAYFDITNVQSPRSPQTHPPKIPIRQIHYHDSSRTVAGIVQLDTGVFDQMRIVMSFSADWRFVSRGVIVKRRRTATSIATTYPLDGEWLVTYTTNNNAEQEQEIIDISGNAFYNRSGDYFFLKISDDRRQLGVMEAGRNGQLPFLNAAVDFTNQQRPSTGDVIQFDEITNHRRYRRCHWKRLSVSDKMPPNEVNPIGATSGRIYQRQHFVTHATRRAPTYHRNTLWGNTFCQGFKIGLASYHFISPEEGAYISYENPAVGQWPPLDNGMPIPSRVPFHNISFENSTFRGEIQWLEDFATSWQGMIKWEYEMVFDSEFTCILSGQVKSISRHREEWLELSRFGFSLIYINAALWDVFQQDRLESPLDNYQSFRDHSDQLRSRLQREGVAVRTLAMIHSLFTVAQSPDASNPIDLNL